MDHPLRKEKTCLNCGMEVRDRYCPHCGQENVQTEETFSQLVMDFIADITHYDSRFFITMKDLLLRPGYLTREYRAGRRVRYLNPIRMYVFISFVFFLVSFSLLPNNDNTKNDHSARVERQRQADSLRSIVAHNKLDPTTGIPLEDSLLEATADGLDTTTNAVTKSQIVLSTPNRNYTSVQDYDSAQSRLPAKQRDASFTRYVIRHGLAVKTRYGDRLSEVIQEKFQHNVPKMMFLLLPLFALLLKMFYSRKKYYYVDHAIFSIHFHSFVFIIFLFAGILDWIFNTNVLGVWSLLFVFVYLVIALRNMYSQSLWRSLFKAIVVSILYSITIIMCLTLVGIFTFFSI